MAWITYQPDPRDEDELRALYADCRDADTGEVDNILRIHARHPAGLRAHLALYRAAMASTAGLRKVDREMIAVVVSAENGCRY